MHRFFSSFFYRTIHIQTTLIDEKGTYEKHKFTLNRNSLIKYIGGAAKTTDSDQIIVNKLNAQLWTSGLNQAGNIPDKIQQTDAGEHGLRHAGQHNQRLISHWSNAIQDFFKGRFLSWLYQKTIASVNLIKMRFLFVRTEKDLFEAGEVLAKEQFHDAYRDVPAYRTHIVTFNGQPVAKTRFCDIPETTKDNYIKHQAHDSDTHVHGRYPSIGKTDTSTGTTGKPTSWVRGEQELHVVKKSLELAAKLQFGNRRLSYINAFALGAWATGLTTYELMRNMGSVFAPGPDKEKILDKLLSIEAYEKHQLELSVNRLPTTDENKVIMTKVISATLHTVLKNRHLSLEAVLATQMKALCSEERTAIHDFNERLISIAKTLNSEKEQTIIAGYPPFLKDLATYAKEKGYELSRFSVIGIVGGQAISEAMRDQLEKRDGFNQVFSSYGASDLDINLGVETEYEITVRKAIEQNPGLARELYGENKGLPMVFHFDPMNYHVECNAANDLLFTCTRNDRSSPRIRYNLGDKGRVYASSDVQALLSKYGIFQQPKSNLPLMFIWGRDSTVVFNGANLAFTELERAITDTDSHDSILKKSFYTYNDDTGAEHLEIWLELNEGIELPEQAKVDAYAKTLISKLVSMNQDFRYQIDKLDEGVALPKVCFFKRNQSPISEAGGHRKQVLIFQKGVNLPVDYQYPDADNFCAANITMDHSLLTTSAQQLSM